MSRDTRTHKAATLVLLPGLDGTGQLFQPLTDCLARDIPYRILAYPPDRPLSLHELACFVADRLPPGPVVLLAECFSGLVALTLLAQQRLVVQHVILAPPLPKRPIPFSRDRPVGFSCPAACCISAPITYSP